MLNCKAIHYAVGAKTILTDVSMSVQAGETVALCGPNGAGKSTLLRIASGEMAPSHGHVTLLDTPLSQWKPSDLAQARAKLSQESHLTFAFRVREVVEMGRFPHEAATSHDDIVDACMSMVGVRDLAPPARLRRAVCVVVARLRRWRDYRTRSAGGGLPPSLALVDATGGEGGGGGVRRDGMLQRLAPFCGVGQRGHRPHRAAR